MSEGGLGIGKLLKAREEGGLVLVGGWQSIPKAREPCAEDGGFVRLSEHWMRLNWLPGVIPTFRGEGAVAGNGAVKFRIRLVRR